MTEWWQDLFDEKYERLFAEARPPLRTAQLTDLRTLESARTAAKQIFAADPQLSAPEHRSLANQVAEFWSNAGDFS